ncbi:tRNA(Ile)-lysidine synthase [Lactococcus hodotermopsidis]|uniref:tRNA(Ile)-lysidine synthase n=1 Tax=Pseudolactococcus hodotermopsidis TaxID=2709157 RepID=A0A6A0BD95_9LACT|nr:tRNA lysidine(34) synthetase TilS [Lactococcus hodotermopsidis]GFH42635.1 tRNA(Ile)-lysidine synthase [Lactococcus hodotermopsidis]
MTAYEKFLKLAQEKAYFQNHEMVLVALSGGIDSMTLFDWLYQAREILNIKLAVAHVNHKQRAESDDEEIALREKMSRLDIPFYTTAFTGRFSEEKARHFRYTFFEKMMIEHQMTVLVTAHHKNDMTENFLIRLIRGSRLRHLTGIEAVQEFGKNRVLIRPLLAFDKSEFETSAYFEDSSNAENTYLRNRVRNHYLPLLKQENPRFEENLASLIDEIKRAMAIVVDSTRAFVTAEKIDLLVFLRESEDLQYFILQDYLAKFPELQISKAQFNDLLQIIKRDGQYNHAISGKYDFIKDSCCFYIEEQSKMTEFETALLPFSDGEFGKINLPETGQIDLRKRQSGDRIMVNGIDKKLRRYFIDEKISLQKRDYPLVTINSKVYGVLGVVESDLSKSLKSDKMRRTLYFREKRRGKC